MEKELDITLFPHNEVAYEALCQSTENYPLAFLEHATGTGKSFILLKFLYKKMRQKRILFVSMHDEMFDQLFDEQMPSLGMKKDDFITFDTLIYHNILKYDMQSIIRNYDCIVFDEAHHCGAEKWSEKVRELKELVLKTPGKVMIGATATGIRYLDDYMDVSEEFFDGKTVSRLPVSKSILKNLLPAPLYINSLSACAETVDRVATKLSRLPKTEEILRYEERINKIKDQVQEENNISSLLQKYDVKPGEKYIVFCKNIEDLKKKQKEAEEWFKDIGPIRTFTAHSHQKKEKNKSEIKAFGEKRPEISLMFAVDIFNEGFHIKGVDGIFMFRKTKSPIIYFQQIGRALSFSVRKKQIKIFDFVDNISENEVIYELYKEIIEEARKLTKEHPENKELYEEILKRFQIIDNTTSIIDELKEIENYINENYIFKNMLNNAIMKLQEYRNFYPYTNFLDELASNRISYEYIRAYEYICKNSDHLTIEQVDELTKLNISFGPDIDMPKQERIKLLQGFKTISELNEALYKDFIKDYINFYLSNNHRPTYSVDAYESNLNKKYRNYLEELSPSKLNKMISNFPFKSTVEEIVLTGNYPDKEAIEEYLDNILEKLINQIPLDTIEIKVTKKLQKTISLKNIKLLSLLNNIDDINYRLEESIAILQNYKETVNPQERFENILLFIANRPVYKAIRTIQKHAKRITTPQFEKLLALNIKLPAVIDMTLEKRLEELGGFNSFYEKEKSDNINHLNDYIIFIVQNSRRPRKDIKEESELAISYEEHLKKSTTTKIREICELLKANHIELTFYEKVIIGDYIEKSILDSYIVSVEKKLLQNDNFTNEELKVLRAIERHSYEISIPYLSDFIKLLVGIREVEEDITKLEEKLNKYPKVSKANLPHDIKYLIRKISNNQKHLTKSLIDRLEKLNIDVSSELKEELSKNSNYVNLFHQEIIEDSQTQKDYLNYLLQNKQRPNPNSQLTKRYRQYLSKISTPRAVAFIKSITSLNIKPSLEERIILGDFYIDSKEVKEYVAQKTNDITVDNLSKRVLNLLTKKVSLSTDTTLRKRINKVVKAPKEEDIEARIVANLTDCIYRNPHQELNFGSTVHKISTQNERKLERLRTSLLAKEFFQGTLRLLKDSKQPLATILTPEEKLLLEKYLKVDFDSEEDLYILREIKALDTEYRLLEKGIQKNEFIKSYIYFIKTHNGEKPNINSTDETESLLAQQYLYIQGTLSTQELRLIERTIKESTIKVVEESFYERFYNFIINSGRFPCGNSDDPNEVQLNNLYVTSSNTLTKEQLLELRKLKKVYSKATLQANMAFAKKANDKLKK